MMTVERFFKHPRLIVAVVAAITLFFALQLPRASLDNNNFRFLPSNDPELVMMNSFDARFGSQNVILVGLERRHGTVLEGDFLERVRSFGEKVGAIDVVDSVTSIVTTPYITGVGDSIVVEPLVPEGFSGSREEAESLKDRLSSWELYRRSLISDDYSAIQVVVTMNIPASSAGEEKVILAHRTIKRLAREAEFPDTTFYVTGNPVFSAVVNDATANDLIFLIPLVVVVVVAVLFFSFRRLSGIVLPLLTVLVSAIWAIGAMPLLGVKLTIISTILPIILVAVGSAYGIHIVSHYYDELAASEKPSDREHRAMIFFLLRKVGRPVLLAALTTFAGFASFCFTPVIPIFEFGIFSSFGVMVAFLISVTLVPAILLIRGPVKKVPRFRTSEIEPGREDPLSGAIATWLEGAVRRRRTTLLIAGLALAVSAVGISRVVIDNVLVEYFKPDTDIVRSDGFIRRHFGGSKDLSLVVSSDIPGEVLRPDLLGAMDGLAAYLHANVPEVGKITGITDMIKRINQVFNADESPEGIAVSAAAPTQNLAPGSSDPSFGFGFAGLTASPAAPERAMPTPGKPRGEAKALDYQALAALFGKALASGESADMGAAEFVRAVGRATNYRGLAYYEIPTDPARYGKTDSGELKSLIANYLVLLAGNVGGFADDPLEPKAVRMSIQLRTVGQVDTDRAIEEIRGYVAARFPRDVRVEIGGSALVEKSLNRLVVQSQMSSVVLSIAMVFLILAVYYRSIVAGLIGLAPLSISILINFAVMGFTGIKLNIGTALVASIAIGIGIDYTIHYMAAYHHEYLSTGGSSDFLRRTFLTSGKAILFNAVSVGAGFAVLGLSRFNMLADLGLLITLTMATSALVSLTVLPVLLTVINPAFIRRPLPSDRIKFAAEAAE